MVEMIKRLWDWLDFGVLPDDGYIRGGWCGSLVLLLVGLGGTLLLIDLLAGTKAEDYLVAAIIIGMLLSMWGMCGFMFKTPGFARSFRYSYQVIGLGPASAGSSIPLKGGIMDGSMICWRKIFSSRESALAFVCSNSNRLNVRKDTGRKIFVWDFYAE
ncbi:MAG: hypothetical protein WC310_00230 [Patescibacteria group bacterium]|jgi:hypothetical protein